jgi:O-acetyl-ADP-ribose deacetylase (regulator of RNase III)
VPLKIIQGDITKINCDAIVNVAGTDLRMGGGVCGAIFNAAGIDELRKACAKLAPIKVSDAAITEGFNLPAKYIIHAARPVYSDGKELLRTCYINALDLAKEYKCESIAFPLMSSGVYGYPKGEAIALATGFIGEWLIVNDFNVYIVVYDKKTFELSVDLNNEISAFINNNFYHYTRYSINKTYLQRDFDSVELKASIPSKNFSDTADIGLLQEMIKQLDEPFTDTLLRIIDAKGKTDVEVYKRANLDRRLFSKIRTGKGYTPGKKTIISLAVALELTLKETQNLLERAGFTLSRSFLFDVIIEYFIIQKRYNIYEINNVLFQYDQSLLGDMLGI